MWLSAPMSLPICIGSGAVILAIFNYNDDDVPAAPAALINEAEEEV